jgi:23S rRNA (adenine2030-N6)-methyltransferase
MGNACAAETALNYRHVFHAGNFADVVKHAVLCRILLYLRQKPAAFRVIDTHAGAGFYDLGGPEAARSPEWRDGIAKVMDAEFTRRVTDLLAPYRQAVAACNTTGSLRNYPGSPLIVQGLLRDQDRLVACELEPKAAAALGHAIGRDRRVKAQEVDGWSAIAAGLPPPERRGLVLVDPPYERDDDFTRLAKSLDEGHRRWATGIFVLWYPIKGRPESDALAKRLRRLGIPKVLRAEVVVSPLSNPARLNGCGLIVVNPPWTLEGELNDMLPPLARLLDRGTKGGGQWRLDWLAGEAAMPR